MKPLFLFVFISAITGLFSQTIENVDFRAERKTIVVRYDFIHPKADTAINVALVFKDQQGGSIVPKSISGDIKNVKPGEGKRIIWDVMADGITLSGKYKAEVSIQRTASSVKIGSQVWATENLNVDRFRNGDPIPQAKTDEEWKRAGENQQPAWCYYNNDPKNGEAFGKLYNWYAVNDQRGLAPSGWHIPSDADWTQLTDFLGGASIAGAKLKSTTGWDSWTEWLICTNCESWNADYRKKKACHVCKDIPRYHGSRSRSGNGINISGFSGLPGGFRNSYGTFEGLTLYALWWSSTKYDEDNAYGRYTSYSQVTFGVGDNYCNMGRGISVRCLRD